MLITDFKFDTGPLGPQVPVGTKVTWINNDSTDHTVTSLGGAPASFDSGHLSNGQKFSFTFTKPGTYKYRCDIHNSMMGTVEVS